MRFMLGVDVGGTFTDLTLADSLNRSLHIHKVRSTPDDPSRAIMMGIAELLGRLGLEASALDYLGHGTTVATNALIERRGANTALVTTSGFGDLLEIGNQTRPSLYDLKRSKPEPMVQADQRFELSERILQDGSIRTPVNESDVEQLAARLKEHDVESVAICFLSSYANAQHEELVASILRRVLPDVFITPSAALVPEFREYPRLSTTVINAYLGPLMERYLTNLASAVKDVGINAEPYITQSNGGILSVAETVAAPVRTAVSGPSAGVVAANYLASQTTGRNLITFDMGGTSADISLVQDGNPLVSSERKVEGWPVRVPMLDIVTIGAGGGSIASIDAGGALKVGPRSAGAIPGPAAYGTGGTDPTVTDANLVLGRLNPNGILGGAMRLDIDAATRAIESRIASRSILSVEDAALGIVDVVNAAMVRAIRSVSVARGFDPHDFSLVAFGGAGALHAVDLAHELGIPRVVVPRAAGTFCSLGLLVADVRSDHVVSQLVRPQTDGLDEVWHAFERLTVAGLEVLETEGIPQDKRRFEFTIDVRYVRQNYELPIALSVDEVGSIHAAELCQRFHHAHSVKYGYSRPSFPVEFVNMRLTAVGELPKPELPSLSPRSGDQLEARSERPVCFGKGIGWLQTPIFAREELRTADAISGPAIVDQLDTTILVPPGYKANVDTVGNLIITHAAGGIASHHA